MSFKEAYRRNESNYTFLVFVILAFLFLIFGSLHLSFTCGFKLPSVVTSLLVQYSFSPPTFFVPLLLNLLYFYML